MIEIALPESWMIALRWLLLLGPVALTLTTVRLRHLPYRARIGGLFAFLYGVAMIFVTHSFALWMGWWRYGWDALMVNDLPMDIVIGGAVLFGPALYFLFPKARPLMLCLPVIVALHGTVFSSLAPLVVPGPYWFVGVVFVFATAHLPAIYLARWTEADTHLPLRCGLLAIMTGGMIFVVLPCLIMQAMGGGWHNLGTSFWIIGPTILLFLLASLIGLSANQTLCLQGLGTPIPLDPTEKLVTTGIYAYVSNPMQLSAALGWLLLGAALHDAWVMAAAIMAWIFARGMVRWHHRHDLLRRFPAGWPEYKANVPEWLPRWRPWVRVRATLTLPTGSAGYRWAARWLAPATGLEMKWRDDCVATYAHPDNARDFEGRCAVAAALTHVSFAHALLGHGWLLLALPWAYLANRMTDGVA